MLIQISRNSLGRSLCLDYVFKNWNQLLVNFNSIPFTLNNLVVDVLSGFNNEYDLEKIESFMRNEHHNLGMTMSSFNEAVEEVNTNIRWMNSYFDLILNWLINTIKQ